MRIRVFTIIMISIAMLSLSGCSLGDQTRTVGVGGDSGGTEGMQSILDSADMDLQTIIETLTDNLAGIHVKRPDPSMLDGILVDNYGSSTPISEMADVTVQKAYVLVINPYDVSSLDSIEEAILASSINIIPENDGKRLKLNFPQITGELLKEFSKEAHEYGRQAKSQIRNVRKDKLDEIKELVHSGYITQDEGDKLKNKLQQSVNAYNEKVDAAVQEKQNEIHEI